MGWRRSRRAEPVSVGQVTISVNTASSRTPLAELEARVQSAMRRIRTRPPQTLYVCHLEPTKAGEMVGFIDVARVSDGVDVCFQFPDDMPPTALRLVQLIVTPDHHAGLLTVWVSNGDDGAGWRFQTPRNGRETVWGHGALKRPRRSSTITSSTAPGS